VVAQIARIRSLLAAREAGGELPAESGDATPHEPLRRLVDRLGLSPFERDVVLLAAAVELDGEVAALVARAGGGDPRPTFALALTVLPEPHWDCLVPQRPLRRWHLLDLGPGATLANRPLTIDEDVLHWVTGLADGDEGLEGLCEPQQTGFALTASQLALADELTGAIDGLDGPLLVRLEGEDLEARYAVATRIAQRLGLRPLLVREASVPEAARDVVRAAVLVDREALVADRLVVVSGHKLTSLLTSRVVVALGDPAEQPTLRRTVLARAVPLPTPGEQIALWEDRLHPLEDRGVRAAVADIAHHYRLPARSVAAIAGEWSATDGADADALRRLTRERARTSLGALAERVETRATWEDLVLPDGQRELLRDLERQVRHRSQVYDDWGFAQKSGRGLGITALFAGESGTGKTMAAEVIARDLGLDLYRIDLSAVVSKYIGETEKNLRRLFDAAETGGAVLLFDEADALFGKRSDVKDSHDRYANLEVAYLLQRMEAYHGLAILTTNLKSNIDTAFTRRLRFVVQFPLPDHRSRAEIWRHALPPQTPVEGLDADVLAALHVSGGAIRAIAVGAAFAAADAGTPVRREHVLRAAQVEYAKAGRTLTDAETAALSARTRGGGS
jgi:vesicle-fusing ATPase